MTSFFQQQRPLSYLLLPFLLTKLGQARRGPYGTCIPDVDCAPPMGWRSWNAYGGTVNQTIMMSVLASMSTVRTADSIDDSGKEKIKYNFKGAINQSFLSLGYNDVGLDDAWQACHAGVDDTFHDINGTPLVNETRFPNMKAMTDHAKSLGMKMGWYANNCICPEKCHFIFKQDDQSNFCFTHKTKPSLHDIYDGDAKATVLTYGYSSTKLDGCGQFLNLDYYYTKLEHYAKLSQSSSESGILIENCHWGITIPTLDWCPFSYFRTSGDIFAEWKSVWKNIQTMIPFGTEKAESGKTLSRPGCWAYPDMLEVGLLAKFIEDRSHFGLWCITSSPLILGHDVTNEEINKRIWPIVSNIEAINVNQVWNGHPGKLHSSSNGDGSTKKVDQSTPISLVDMIEEDNLSDKESKLPISQLEYQIWMKPQSNKTMALLFVSNGEPPINNSTDGPEKVHFPKFRIISNGDDDSVWVDAENGQGQGQKDTKFSNNKAYQKFSVRSIWDQKDLGIYQDYYQPEPLVVRDSHFFLVTLMEDDIMMNTKEAISATKSDAHRSRTKEEKSASTNGLWFHHFEFFDTLPHQDRPVVG